MADQRRAPEAPQEETGEKEVLINVNRVTRVVKGGRRFRMQALVVVGNGDDMVGIGLGKAGDVQSAAAKASKAARKNMKKIVLSERNKSIPHEVTAKKSGAQIFLKPASLGTGLIAGGTVRSVLSVTGVHNILSKSLGSSNKINCAYATVDALTQLVPEDQWQTRSSKKASAKVEAK
jgi:small subunit ribosomal protein S5